MWASAVLLILLASSLPRHPAVAAIGATTVNTGRTQISFAGDPGDSNYTIDYSFPAQLQTDRSFNVTVVLFVDQLTHLKQYLVAYEIDATLYLSNGKAIIGKVASPVAATPLYQGSHWGPNNITIRVTPAASGVEPGESVQGYLSLRLIADVWYAIPPPGSPWHYPETDARQVGNVTVTNEETAGSWFITQDMLFVAAAVATGVGALVVLRRRL